MFHKPQNILLVDRGRPGPAYLSSMLALHFCHDPNSKIIVLTDSIKNNEIIKIYKKYNFKHFIVCFQYSVSFFFKNLILFIKSFYLLLKNLIVIKKKGFEWFKINFQIKGIEIGDLFHDTNNRYNLRFIDKRIDFYLINILFKSIFRTLKILETIKEKNIKLIVSHHSGYAYNGSLSVRIGVKLGIKVIESRASNYILWEKKKISNGYHNLICCGMTKRKFNIYSKNLNNKKLIFFLKKRYQSKTSSNYTGPENLLFGNYFKTKMSREEIFNYFKIGKKNINKIVLIAPHAFSDASHVLGTKFIFQDYYEHLSETLQFIKKKKIQNVLWIIRPHPSSKRYGEIGIVENLVKNINCKFIKLCPKNISTENLVNICDNVITGRGTVGLEFACSGKYSLNSGSSAYSGLGISLDFSNKQKYFSALKKINEVPKLSKKKIFLARLVLHYLEVDSTLWKNDVIYNNAAKIFSKKNFLFKHSKLYKEINKKLKKKLILDNLI